MGFRASGCKVSKGFRHLRAYKQSLGRFGIMLIMLCFQEFKYSHLTHIGCHTCGVCECPSPSGIVTKYATSTADGSRRKLCGSSLATTVSLKAWYSFQTDRTSGIWFENFGAHLQLKPRVQGLEGSSQASLCRDAFQENPEQSRCRNCGDAKSRTLMHAAVHEWFRGREKAQQPGMPLYACLPQWQDMTCFFEL